MGLLSLLAAGPGASGFANEPAECGAELAAQDASWLVSPDGQAAVRSAMGLRGGMVQRVTVEHRPGAAAGRVASGLSVPDQSVPNQRVVQIELLGEARTLALEPFSVRSARFSVLVDDGAGELKPLTVEHGGEIPLTTYRGRVEELAGAEVAASMVADSVGARGGKPSTDRLRSATIRIEAQGRTELYRVQPLSDVFPLADPDLYMVYADEDLIDDGVHHCGTDLAHQIAPQAGGGDAGSSTGLRGPGITCNRLSEVVIDTDYEYYSTFLGFPNPSAACVADVEAIVNEVDFAISRDISVSTTINTVVLRTTIDDPYTDATAHGTLLNEHRTLWSAISQATQPRDYVHLFTGRDLDGGIIGVAYVGVICNNTYGCGLSQVSFSSTFARRALLVAHEMGHQWNAPHDNQTGSACAATPDGFIMNPSLGSQALQYSACSITQMSSYRDSSTPCVSTPTSAPLAKADAAYGQVTQVLDIDVLANDVSNCGAMTLSLPSTTTPAGATLSLRVGAGPHGRDLVRWTPPAVPALYNGTDSFSYTVTNPVGPVTQSVGVTIEPPLSAEFPFGTVNGLNVRYFSFASTPSVLPNFASLVPYAIGTANSVNYATTAGNFATSGLADNVGAVFKGYVNVPTTGAYTFFTNSDDGSKLYIGNELVVSNDGLHGAQERSGVIGLIAGKHSLRLEYFEGTGSCSLSLSYQGPTTSKQNIPFAALFRVPPCPADIDFDETVSVNDLFVYLERWFAQNGMTGAGLSADADASNSVTVNDLFVYLSRWFSVC